MHTCLQARQVSSGSGSFLPMSLDHEVALLARCPALRSYEADALRLVAFAAERLSWQKGEVLFRPGDVAKGAIVVLDGQLQRHTGDSAGPMDLGPGEVIDEMAMYIDCERVEEVVALRTASGMLLSRDMIRRVLLEFPQSASAVRRDVAARLDHLSGELATVGERLSAIDEAAG